MNYQNLWMVMDVKNLTAVNNSTVHMYINHTVYPKYMKFLCANYNPLNLEK